MDPERRRKPELHPESQGDDDRTEDQDNPDGRAIAGIALAEVKSTDLASLADREHALKQPAATAFRAASRESGVKD